VTSPLVIFHSFSPAGQNDNRLFFRTFAGSPEPIIAFPQNPFVFFSLIFFFLFLLLVLYQPALSGVLERW